MAAIYCNSTACLRDSFITCYRISLVKIQIFSLKKVLSRPYYITIYLIIHTQIIKYCKSVQLFFVEKFSRENIDYDETDLLRPIENIT